MPVDEGPSEEDIERFSKNETGYCPNCGEEIWDDANRCHACNEWFHTAPLHQDPITRDFNKKWIIVISILVLVGFLWGMRRYF